MSVRDDEHPLSQSRCGAPYLTITFSKALITDLKSAQSLWRQQYELNQCVRQTLNHNCIFPKTMSYRPTPTGITHWIFFIPEERRGTHQGMHAEWGTASVCAQMFLDVEAWNWFHCLPTCFSADECQCRGFGEDAWNGSVIPLSAPITGKNSHDCLVLSFCVRV